MADNCYHCSEPVPAGCDLTVIHEDVTYPVCCAGCQAVASLIIDGGQGDYYRFREVNAPKVDEKSLAALDQWQAFDQDVDVDDQGVAGTHLLIEGLHCSACSWLIENQVGRMDGVVTLNVDQSNGVAVLRWLPDQLPLSKVLARLVQLGYRPHPLDSHGIDQRFQRERNSALKRLAVAGLGMMQVMMYTFGTYFGDSNSMSPSIERLLFLVAMVVTTPVVFYSGAPFFSSALQAIRTRQLNMDVPIVLALLLAYGSGCLNYFRGSGEMYFESATMFVFLLLCSRFIAMNVRHRSAAAHLALASMLPDVVIRLIDGNEQKVPRSALNNGDIIRVRPGDSIPVDGTLRLGNTTVDESLLTGEATPQSRSQGDTVLAGSVNIDGSIEIRAEATNQGMRINQMAALVDRAQQQRPTRVLLANRVAGYFVIGVLILAAAVFAGWYSTGLEAAINATLAVLVVTCPCALSLAIPTAMSAATVQLARHGLLLSRHDTLEALPKIDMAVFDKTGTLSDGRPELGNMRLDQEHPNPVSQPQLIEWVAALERHSNHPIASTFSDVPVTDNADSVQVIPGSGIQGWIAGRELKVGSADFVGVSADGSASVYVADQEGLLGTFDVVDHWRDDSADLVQSLKQRDIACTTLSGDGHCKVDQAVDDLGLDWGEGCLLPEQKLTRMHSEQQAGRCVMAVGDGVNDTALLAGADFSVALAQGADLAQVGADAVLTGNHLLPINELFDVSRKMKRIISQNLAWAVGYNLLAVPLAASGLIGPGLAALGMSASSLVVVLNALRLIKKTKLQTGSVSTETGHATTSGFHDQMDRRYLGLSS